MSTSYPPRIEKFRHELIRAIPKVPNTKETKAYMNTFGMHHLILVYLTWQMRQIPKRSRQVMVWSGGVAPDQFACLQPLLQPLINKVERGQDLTPHLSRLVGTTGFEMSGTQKERQRKELDWFLIKHGLHHFHVGTVTATNPRGRSGSLVFAAVSDEQFRIIALSDHHAFEMGSTEQQRISEISHRYIQSQIPPDAAYMAYPTMSSGHPMDLVRYADYCSDVITRLDPCLDERSFIDKLYNENDVKTKLALSRPKKPTLRWHFENGDFGVCETKTGVFFRMSCAPR